MAILVTGATGQLGAPTLAALQAAGHAARGSSSTGRNGLVHADLFTAQGLDQALDRVETIVHCAQTGGAKDLRLARNLTAAAQRAGVGHMVLISIVGIEDIPMPYYDQRVEIEKIARASGVPLTIQRATQFHTLIDQLFNAQRRMPVVIAPAARFQTIAVPEVAGRLAELAAGGPRGRVDDIGGPEQVGIGQLYRQWRDARGGKRPCLQVRLPFLEAFRGLDAGANLVPGEPFGRQTFAHYVQEKYAPGS
ncbi:SDR family oxidoreductase [Arthrobacter sp. JSM 101049]|uniref:SDR family oxidoreductase n=1 Tax=Arthrobacter sp. JSM 101049 TaxID=929097 RepID=UPI003566EE69